jgi:hypothetical protein
MSLFITANDVVVDFDTEDIDLGDGNGPVPSFTTTTTYHAATEESGEYYSTDGVNLDTFDGGVLISYPAPNPRYVFIPMHRIFKITT